MTHRIIFILIVLLLTYHVQPHRSEQELRDNVNHYKDGTDAEYPSIQTEQTINNTNFKEILDQFMLDIIYKYDQTQEGNIPISSYASFLQEFISGSSYMVGEDNDGLSSLLNQATIEFVKKQYSQTKQDYVDIETMMNDLMSDFTIFLYNNQEDYQKLISQLFGGIELGEEDQFGDEQIFGMYQEDQEQYEDEEMDGFAQEMNREEL